MRQFPTNHDVLAWQQRALRVIRRLPGGWLIAFTVRQAWAALFGALMLLGIVVTSYVALPGLTRYDWLFVWAVAIQVFMLATKLERPREVLTIILFHFIGLMMELFKTSAIIGSWHYPGDAYFRIATVPLFSGFMYAAVGSYIARAWRVLHLNLQSYPKRLYTYLLAAAIYINFFSHHYMYDLRWVLLALVIVLYGRTNVTYAINCTRHRMPLVAGFGLITCFIWLAENIGTYTKSWLYPDQVAAWHIVSPHKLVSWLLLMVISFIMIDALHYRNNIRQTPKKPA